jgi:tungstate transport system substrate-binding protein
MIRNGWIALLVGAAIAAPAARTADASESITLASTTSTRDSGFLDAILPVFQATTGIEVRVVAVGTGRALDLARRGDADVLLVHDRASEEAFVAEGFGLARHPVMYNDFVLVGPDADPAGVRGRTQVTDALVAIAKQHAAFLSRGDDSGTHKAERRLWRAAGLDPSARQDAWYRETGAGMGATLNTAAQMPAYTFSDRGTWLSFLNRQDLTLLVENDPRLRNEYGILVVDPARHPHVKHAAAQALVAWMTSEAGRTAIASFRVAGQQLFFPIEPGPGTASETPPP